MTLNQIILLNLLFESIIKNLSVMKKGELIIGVLAIISILLNLFLVPGGGFLSVVFCLTLSVFYFLFSFALFNNIKLKSLIKNKSTEKIIPLRIVGAVGLGFAIPEIIIGILFKIQNYPGADLYLLVGLIILLIISIVSLVKYLKNKPDFYIRIFKRVAIYGSLGLIVLLLPSDTISEFKYRNHPEFLENTKDIKELENQR